MPGDEERMFAENEGIGSGDMTDEKLLEEMKKLDGL